MKTITESTRLRIELNRTEIRATAETVALLRLRHTKPDGQIVCWSERLEYTSLVGNRAYYALTAERNDGKLYFGEVFPNSQNLYVLFDSANGSKIGEFRDKSAVTKWVKSHLL